MRRCGAGKLFLEEPTKTSLITCLLREEETQRYGWGAKGQLLHDQPFSRSSAKIARLLSERHRPLSWSGPGCRHIRALDRSQMSTAVQSAALTMPMQHDAPALHRQPDHGPTWTTTRRRQCDTLAAAVPPALRQPQQQHLVVKSGWLRLHSLASLCLPDSPDNAAQPPLSADTTDCRQRRHQRAVRQLAINDIRRNCLSLQPQHVWTANLRARD